jgi:hypothetical protein
MLESLNVILETPLKIQLDDPTTGKPASHSSDVSEVIIKPFSFKDMTGGKRKKFRKMKHLFRNAMIVAHPKLEALSEGTGSVSTNPEDIKESEEEDTIEASKIFVVTLLSLDTSFDIDAFTELFIDFVAEDLIFVKGRKVGVQRFFLEKLDENDLESILLNYIAAFFLDSWLKNMS